MRRLPPTVDAYRRTPEFDAASIPAGLRRAHRTKAGTWGRIVVLEGELLYRILAPELEEHVLAPGRVGVVEPDVPHEVRARGEVRFYVEFLRES